MYLKLRKEIPTVSCYQYTKFKVVSSLEFSCLTTRKLSTIPKCSNYHNAKPKPQLIDNCRSSLIGKLFSQNSSNTALLYTS